MYTGEVDQMTNLKRKRDVDLQKLEQQETAGGDGKGKDKKEDSDAEVGLVFIVLPAYGCILYSMHINTPGG